MTRLAALVAALALAGCWQTINMPACQSDCNVVVERGGNAPSAAVDMGVLP